jgi:hypothetical protein
MGRSQLDDSKIVSVDLFQILYIYPFMPAALRVSIDLELVPPGRRGNLPVQMISTCRRGA